MRTVLVVEDNEANREMLVRRLSRRGFQIAEADTGEAAVSLARELQPDVILLDMSLPVISGWEAARILKAGENTSYIPVIALTAHAMEADRLQALEAGCDEYETKPVELDKLVSKMNRLMGDL